MTFKEIKKLYEKNQSARKQKLEKFRTILKDFYELSHKLIESVPDKDIEKVLSGYMVDNLLCISGDGFLLLNEESFKFQNPLLNESFENIMKQLEEFNISNIALYFNLEKSDSVLIYLNTQDYFYNLTSLSERANRWNQFVNNLTECFGKYLKTELNSEEIDMFDIDISFFYS